MHAIIMRNTWTSLMAAGFLALPVLAAGEMDLPLPLLPQPVNVQRGEGAFQLNADTKIIVDAADADARNVGEQLAARLKQWAGLELTTEPQDEGRAIELTRKNANPALGPEGYTLTVKPDGVVIAATTGAGLFYGMQTLLQL